MNLGLVPVAALSAVLLTAALCPDRAAAQTSPWKVEGTVGVASDYRFRGSSLSGGDPAVQGGLTLSHASGLYGDVYLSSIEEYGPGADGDGARVEVTLTGGWAGSINGFDLDVGISAFQYPDGSDVNYVEIPAQVGRSIGSWTWTVGAAYAPEQTALGDEDNRYVWGGVDFAPEAWPVSLNATVGYEDGAYAPAGKTDWLVGASIPVGSLMLGLAWVDSDVDEGAVVASLFASF